MLPSMSKTLLMLAGIAFAISGRAQQADTLPAQVRSELIQNFGAESRYMSAMADLNSDGQPEVIVYIVGAGNCGSGGCPLVIYAKTTSGYRAVTTTSVTQTPIRLSPRSSHGWRNIIVAVSGGGVKSRNAELAFNGKSYPANPTVPPAKATQDLSGTTILIGEMKSFEDAKPLAEAGPGNATASNANVAKAAGPGFDCGKANSPAEKLICSDAELAGLDRKLTDVYGKAIEQWTKDGIVEQERSKQRSWIASRNRCGASKECLHASYERRIAEVQIQSGQFSAPKPVDYTCKGSKEIQLTASFYNETDPPSAVITLGPDTQVIALTGPTGSGARYTAPNFEFWEHHGDAILKWSGATLNCAVSK
jgi:uncharacterized protein